ncbi:MAG: methyltransferase domain-containing protein [Pseudomonadota bacterium]
MTVPLLTLFAALLVFLVGRTVPALAPLAVGCLVLLLIPSTVWVLENLHLLLARLRLRPTRASSRYIRALFDGYAPSFETDLMVDLRYAVPNLLMDIVTAHHDGRVSVALDLGCGTGICGPLFAPYCDRLTGIDLSAEMLRHARAKRCYDDLVQGDFTTYLHSHPIGVDLCIAADVLVYYGALKQPLGAIAAGLRSGGQLAFTLEAHGSGDGPAGRGWYLRRTGRYAHEDTYVRRVAEEVGLETVACWHACLRTQAGAPVEGLVLLLAKP